MITIVIPYFQRSAGILRKALASIAAQQGCPMPMHVLVVDDASPVSAADEVAAVNMPASISIQVIRQENSGPGAARNTGLDAAPASTQYVAFLDSDDEWSTDHLARAIAALQLGYNFYFANFYQLGQVVGAFERANRIQVNQHQKLQAKLVDIYAYRGNLFDQVLRGNVIGTSTVVYCWLTFSKIRFQVNFQSAGEDYLFWMALAIQSAKTTFSTKIETTYGKGVNIYAGAGWGTASHLQRIHDEIKFRHAICYQFNIDKIQRRHVQSDLQNLRLAFVRDLLHRIKNHEALPMRLLVAHARVDLMTFINLPISFARILMGR
jgi:succinoglycan biosynthesis protein ExoW